MLNLPEKIILFDTEFTAWPGSLKYNWSRPEEFREIIQIGAVLIETKKFRELGHFNCYVKPVKNPKLSAFIIRLTGITQNVIDRRGVSFYQAIKQFATWSKSYPLYSYGRDREHVKNNCKLAGIAFPLEKKRFRNLKIILARHGIPTDKYTSGHILEALGRKTKRRAHNALNDARTLAEGLKILTKRLRERPGKIPPAFLKAFNFFTIPCRPRRY